MLSMSTVVDPGEQKKRMWSLSSKSLPQSEEYREIDRCKYVLAIE